MSNNTAGLVVKDGARNYVSGRNMLPDSASPDMSPISYWNLPVAGMAIVGIVRLDYYPASDTAIVDGTILGR